MEINSCLTSCSICKQRYDSPRFLPCEETSCSQCILKNIIKGNLNCFFCKQVHFVPENGFPVNKTLEKLINTVETNLIRSSNYDHFRQKLNSNEQILDQLEYDLNNRAKTVHDECKAIVDKINLETEKRIQELNNSKKELTEKVLNYEHEIMVNLGQSNLRQYQEFIIDSKRYLDEQKSYLWNLNEAKIKEGLNGLKNFEWKLHGQRRKVHNTIFNHSKLNFVMNESTKLGQIIKSNTSEIDLNKLKKIELADYLSSPFFIRNSFCIEILDNGNYIIDYLDNLRTFWIIELHDLKQKRPLKCLKEPLSDKYCDTLIKSFGSKIIFYYKFKTSQYLMITDNDLNKIYTTPCQYEVESLQPIDDKIICSIKDESTQRVCLYDWNLNELMVISSNSSYFFFENNITDIFSNGDFLIFHENKRLRFMDKVEGRTFKILDFNSEFNLISANSTSFIIDDRTENMLCEYDFNGELIEAKSLLNFPHLNHMQNFLEKNGNFIFVDYKDFRIYLA